jgi:hypothetical protein
VSKAPTVYTNLSELFPRYRLSWDESDESGHQDPWSMELIGKFGKVFPHGGDRLGGILWDHPSQRTKLFNIIGSPYRPGKKWQKGDEVAFTFSLDEAPAVFAALRLRKRRKPPSPSHLQALRAGLERHKALVGSTPSTQEAKSPESRSHTRPTPEKGGGQ